MDARRRAVRTVINGVIAAPAPPPRRGRVPHSSFHIPTPASAFSAVGVYVIAQNLRRPSYTERYMHSAKPFSARLRSPLLRAELPPRRQNPLLHRSQH